MARLGVFIPLLGLACACAVAIPSSAGGATTEVESPTTASLQQPPIDDTPLSGADPGGYVVRQQDYTDVYEPPPGIIAAAPLADAFDAVDARGNPTRSVLMSWTSQPDIATATAKTQGMLSYDRGYTFPSGIADGVGGFYAQLRDGSILGVQFIPDKVVNPHEVALVEQISTDGGKTWKKRLAPFTTDKTFDPTRFNRGIRVDRDITQLPDGDLLLTYYTEYKGESAGTSELAISHDQGKSWSRYATIFPPQGNRTFNETAVSWAVNGDLVAVARSHLGSALSGMYTARSTDQGRTWSPATPVKITTQTGEPAPKTGIMPDLRLLPNGVMALEWGRPDNWIAISPDGLGKSFEHAQVTYQNYPKTVLGSYQRWHGSSGNGALAVVNSNRVLAVGDNCAASWGCPPIDSGFLIDNKYRIWKKFVNINTPGVGKIDLLGKYEHGKVTINTDMTAANHRFPQMRPVGAIDGSTDWGSSAVRNGGHGPATYTLKLDQTYTLTKLGLSLKPGMPESATVQVSTDGTHWQPVVDTGSLTSRALKYYPLDKPSAKYVKVTVNGGPSDHSGTFLNEIELYSTVDSFENDTVRYVPRGYTDAIGATVTATDTDGSSHALRLADAWKDKTAQATWIAAPAPKQDLSFTYQNPGYARTLQFITMGITAAGTPANAFQVAQLSNGSIAWYSDTAHKWTELTAANAAPRNQWHAIKVEATLTSATISLDGKKIGTIPPTTGGVTALTGHKFATTGTAVAGDDFVIDNVEDINP